MHYPTYSCYFPKPGPFGWGRASENLKPALDKLGISTYHAETQNHTTEAGRVVLSAVSDFRFEYTSDRMGKKNVGYAFIENNMIASAYAYKANRLWDHVVCGSQWMKDWLEELMPGKCSVAVQGVERNEFYPISRETERGGLAFTDYFTVGSFGKFELRKSQDIVIKAMQVFCERHKDVKLIYNWHNDWPQLIRDFAWCNHSLIKMPYSMQDSRYRDGSFFESLLDAHGINDRMNASYLHPNNWDSLVTRNSGMLEWYRSCDVILFPNRCEAGTNLCLMEALASGVPCIASDATGHTDITRQDWYPHKDLLLTCGKPKPFQQGDLPLGLWHEPCLDEVVSKLEYAYRMKEDLMKRRHEDGLRGHLTWDQTAGSLYQAMRSQL